MSKLAPTIVLLLAACAQQAPRLPQPATATVGAAIAGPILTVHNRERAMFGAPSLVWDEQLAAGASAYARQLAAIGTLHHSDRATRPGIGENLWIGTRGAFTIETMAESWASERRRFRPGTFPAISRTGNWADVGHYTQMVWPATDRIGCGLAGSARWDVLVCRYAPAGNVVGVLLAPR
jgi:hypothetical protein